MNEDICYSTFDILANEYQKEIKDYRRFCLPSGIEDIDEAMVLCPGNLIVVGGAPRMGKSSLVNFMLRKQLKLNIPVAYLTTENLNHPMLWDMFVSSVFDNDTHDYYHHDCFTYIQKTVVQENNLYLKMTPMLTLQEIKRTAEVLIKEYGVMAIYIESLQSVALAEDEPTSNCIKRVCLELRALAMNLRVPIIITSELDTEKVNERLGNGNKRPCGSDLKGCKYIKDIADVILLLYRPEYYGDSTIDKDKDFRGVLEVFIEKNNYGMTCYIPLCLRNGRIFEKGSSDDLGDEKNSEEVESFINSSPVMREFVNKLQLEVEQKRS